MVASNGSSSHFHAFFRPTKFNIVACLLTVIALVYCAQGYWSLRTLVGSQATQLALFRVRNNELRMRETELSETLDSLNKRVELVLESERNYKQRYTICSDEKQAADGSLAAKSTDLASAEQQLSDCRVETSDLLRKSDDCAAQLNTCSGGAEALGRSERNATAQIEALRSKLKQQDEELAAASVELRTLRAASKYRASVAEDEAICDNTWFAKIGRLLRSGQSPADVLLTLGFRRSDIQASAERQLAVNNLRQSSLYGGNNAAAAAVDYEQQALRDRVQNIRRTAEGAAAAVGTAAVSAVPASQLAPGSEQNAQDQNQNQDSKPVASVLPGGASRGDWATAASQVQPDQTAQHQENGEQSQPDAQQAQSEQQMLPSQNQPEEQQQPQEPQPQPEEQQQLEKQQMQPEEQQQPEKLRQEQQLPEDPQHQPEGQQQQQMDDRSAGNGQVQQEAQQPDQQQQPSANQQQQQQQQQQQKDDQLEQEAEQQPEQDEEQQKNGAEEKDVERAPADAGYEADEPDHPESADDRDYRDNRAAVDDKVAQYVADAAAEDAAADRPGNEAGEGKDDGQGYDDANNDPADDDEGDDDVVDDGVIADGVNDDDDIDPKAYANDDDRDGAYNQANDGVGDGEGDGDEDNVDGPYADGGDDADKRNADNAVNAQDGDNGAADEDGAGDDGPPAEEDEDMPVDNR